jgi:hypothetical protein
MFTPHDETQTWLATFLTEHHGVAGTVHVERGGDLYLTAAQNIPTPVVATVAHVARGKGMAGLAQINKAPIQTCNLQTDDTGRIKPGAKAVSAQSAVALPVLDAGGGIAAIVGVAFAEEGEVPPERVAKLMTAAAGVPRSA